MAITIDHKAFSYTGSAFLGIQAIYNYMTGPGSARFSIVASSGIGFDNGWLVFSLVGGTGWQCWLGGRASAASTWSLANFEGSPGSLPNNNIFMAFSSQGGWDVGVDSPAGTMFSLCPSVNGGAVGQYWFRIRSIVSNSNQMGSSTYAFTLWDDPSTGFFCFLMDKYSGSTPGNNWGSPNGGLGIFPLLSRYGLTDPSPYVVLTDGQPSTSSPGWFPPLFTIGQTDYGSGLLHPLDSRSPPVKCVALLEPLRIFTTTTQPNPLTGEYDLDPLAIYSRTPGWGHSRGLIHPACMRQGMDTGTNRETFGDGSWIVPMTNAGILLPWDKNIVL